MNSLYLCACHRLRWDSSGHSGRERVEVLRILDVWSDDGASQTTEPRLLWQETIEMLLKARVMLLDRASTHSLSGCMGSCRREGTRWWKRDIGGKGRGWGQWRGSRESKEREGRRERRKGKRKGRVSVVRPETKEQTGGHFPDYGYHRLWMLVNIFFLFLNRKHFIFNI